MCTQELVQLEAQEALVVQEALVELDPQEPLAVQDPQEALEALVEQEPQEVTNCIHLELRTSVKRSQLVTFVRIPFKCNAQRFYKQSNIRTAVSSFEVATVEKTMVQCVCIHTLNHGFLHALI